MRSSRLLRRALALAAALIFAWLARESGLGSGLEGVDDRDARPEIGAATSASRPEVERDPDRRVERGGDPLEAAFAERRSGFFVTLDATVLKRARRPPALDPPRAPR